MDVSFSSGLKVNVSFDGYTVETDQPTAAGGEGTSPSPFKTFLASLAACSGYYVLKFCRSREIPVDGVSLTLDTVYDKVEKRVSDVVVKINLPADFPEQYRDAVVRAAGSCAIKKLIQDPPRFTITAE